MAWPAWGWGERPGTAPSQPACPPCPFSMPLHYIWNDPWVCSLPHQGPWVGPRKAPLSSECSGGINCSGSHSQEAVKLGSEPRTARFSPGTRHPHLVPAQENNAGLSHPHHGPKTEPHQPAVRVSKPGHSESKIHNFSRGHTASKFSLVYTRPSPDLSLLPSRQLEEEPPPSLPCLCVPRPVTEPRCACSLVPKGEWGSPL